jgi:hypothetical protein
MQFPAEIERIVKEFAQPCVATLRSDWRNGSDTMRALNDCDWWKDYQHDMKETRCDGLSYSPYRQVIKMKQDSTWVYWCYSKMIIGPPRYRSDREIAGSGLDDEYLNDDDIQRHYCPWVYTWPSHNDRSWCIPSDVPDWAKLEFMLEN